MIPPKKRDQPSNKRIPVGHESGMHSVKGVFFALLVCIAIISLIGCATTEQVVAVKIAVEEKDWKEYRGAVEKPADQAMQTMVAGEGVSSDVRLADIAKLTDQVELEKIALEDKSKYVRLAAAARLDALFASATRITGFSESDLRTGYAILKMTPVEGKKDIDALIDHVSDAKMVLLGEGSHGTVEYYKWRAEISRRLVEDYGFDFIVVEGDWPSLYQVNRYVKGYIDRSDTIPVLTGLDRWPPWMWKNSVVAELMQWLRHYNDSENRSVGFYGMDVYGISRSYDQVLEIIEHEAPEQYQTISELYECLRWFKDDMQSYAKAVANRVANCENEVNQAYDFISENILPELSSVQALNLQQNAAVLVYGERHYRAMVDPRMDGWNERVKFMHQVVKHLLDYYGEDARGIIWAHNTHIGDARATDMARQGHINIGQLMRESLGEQRVRLVGFGSATGTVKAGSSWGSPGKVMNIPTPVEDSYEHVFSQIPYENVLFLFDDSNRHGPLMDPMGHRAIGVLYHPEREHMGNFVLSVLPLRYDAFVFFQKTEALRELRF